MHGLKARCHVWTEFCSRFPDGRFHTLILPGMVPSRKPIGNRFPSWAVTSARMSAGDTIIAHEWIHAGLVDGGKGSGTTFSFFCHSNLDPPAVLPAMPTKSKPLLVIDAVSEHGGRNRGGAGNLRAGNSLPARKAWRTAPTFLWRRPGRCGAS